MWSGMTLMVSRGIRRARSRRADHLANAGAGQWQEPGRECSIIYSYSHVRFPSSHFSPDAYNTSPTIVLLEIPRVYPF